MLSNAVRRARAAVIVLFVAGLLAGCSHPSPGAGRPRSPVPDQPAPVTATPTPTGPHQLTPLPIASFLLSDDQDIRLTRAAAVLIHSCAKRFGYDYQSPTLAGSADSQLGNNPDGDLPNVDPDATGIGYRDRAATHRQVRNPSGPPPSRQLLTVLAGSTPRARKPSPTTVNGKRVPPGGCIGEARRTISGDADPATVFTDPALVVNVRLDAYFKTASDNRVKAVFAAWSACMAARGFRYATPLDAVKDRRWNVDLPPTRLELNTAAADVKCKYQYNVNGVFHAIEAAFETAAIEQNRQSLERIKTDRADALRRAGAISAGHS